MKKKIMSLLLCGLMIMSLAGCGEREEINSDLVLKDGKVRVEFSDVEILDN